MTHLTILFQINGIYFTYMAVFVLFFPFFIPHVYFSVFVLWYCDAVTEFHRPIVSDLIYPSRLQLLLQLQLFLKGFLLLLPRKCLIDVCNNGEYALINIRRILDTWVFIWSTVNGVVGFSPCPVTHMSVVLIDFIVGLILCESFLFKHIQLDFKQGVLV